MFSLFGKTGLFAINKAWIKLSFDGDTSFYVLFVVEYQFCAWTAFSLDTWNFHQTGTCPLSCLSSLASHNVMFSIMIKELLDLLHYHYNRFHDELWVNIHFSSRSKKERSWWFMYVLLFVLIDFQNVSASWLFIAIKRQWCLECILWIEGFAKTKGFLLCSDLQQNIHF